MRSPLPSSGLHIAYNSPDSLVGFFRGGDFEKDVEKGLGRRG